jgi:hypothetical protein
VDTPNIIANHKILILKGSKLNPSGKNIKDIIKNINMKKALILVRLELLFFKYLDWITNFAAANKA